MKERMEENRLEMGESVCAFVVPKSGCELTFDGMIAFLRQRKLASYKLSERLVVLDQLPLTGEEKVDKKSLVRFISEKLKTEGKI